MKKILSLFAVILIILLWQPFNNAKAWVYEYYPDGDEDLVTGGSGVYRHQTDNQGNLYIQSYGGDSDFLKIGWDGDVDLDFTNSTSNFIFPDNNGGFYKVTRELTHDGYSYDVYQPMLMRYDSEGVELWEDPVQLVDSSVSHYIENARIRESDGYIFFLVNDVDFGDAINFGYSYLVTDPNGIVVEDTLTTVPQGPLTDQYCSNEAGIAGTVGYDVRSWKSCWDWCFSSFGGLAQMCQWNGGLRECSTKYAPTGGLVNCTFEDSPWGSWVPFFGYNGLDETDQSSAIRLIKEEGYGWGISNKNEGNGLYIDSEGNMNYGYYLLDGNTHYYAGKVDDEGNLLYEYEDKELTVPEDWYTDDMIKTDNGEIWVVHGDSGTDYYYDVVYLQGYDLNGDFLYPGNGLLIGSYSDLWDVYSYADVDSDGNVYVISEAWDSEGSGDYITETRLQVITSGGDLLYPGNGLLLASYPDYEFEAVNFSLLGEDAVSIVFTSDLGLEMMLVINGGQVLFQDSPMVLTDNPDDDLSIGKAFAYGTAKIIYHHYDGFDFDSIKSTQFISAQQVTTTSGLVVRNSNGDIINPGSDFGVSEVFPDSTDNILIQTTDNAPIALIRTDMSADRDWTEVTAETDNAVGMAYITGLDSAPGAFPTHSLYVPIPEGITSGAVLICPDATSFLEINYSCADGDVYYLEDEGVSQVVIGDLTYWKVDNLTGTGGLSLTTTSLEITPSSFDVEVGESLSVTVIARDVDNNVDTSYRGIVEFTSTSATAILPEDYEFGEVDAGQKTFTNQVTFIESGDFTITVTDVNDGGLTGTTVSNITVHDEAPTNAPTSAPESSITPTTTLSVTSTPDPSLTITPTVTPTPGISCVVNVLQVKCQVDVIISDVFIEQLGDNSVKISWDTNTETKGTILYGTSEGEIYNESTLTEAVYGEQGHSFVLEDLTDNTSYIYKIIVISVAGKTAIYEGDFIVGQSTLPETGDAGDCIMMNANGYTFNGLGQAVLYYSVPESAMCLTNYGGGSNKTNFSSPSTQGINHKSVLGLENMTGSEDLYFKINCELDDENASPNKCVSNGVITHQQYGPYVPVIKTVSLYSVLDEFFGSNAKASTTMTVISTLGAGATFGVLSLVYPQWASYGVLWLTGRKPKKMWGLVYDFKTKTPIPFAIVRATNKSSGMLVKQTITDTQGRYGLILDKGVYRIEVSQNEYEAVSKDVSLERAEDTLALDLGLSKESGREAKSSFVGRLRGIIVPLSLGLTVAGLIITVIAVLLSLSVFNIAILIIYAIQGAVFLLSIPPRGWGKVMSKDGNLIQGAFVRLFDKELGRQVDVQITDKKGRFGFLVDNKGGPYLLKVDATGYSFPGEGQGNIYKAPSGQSFIAVDKNEMRNININLG